MKQSDHFRENAENCARLAEAATNEPLHLRYKRMEAAWLALANEQDWLDGEVPSIDTEKSLPREAALFFWPIAWANWPGRFRLCATT
jgi:hypothetical protein